MHPSFFLLPRDPYGAEEEKRFVRRHAPERLDLPSPPLHEPRARAQAQHPPPGTDTPAEKKPKAGFWARWRKGPQLSPA